MTEAFAKEHEGSCPRAKALGEPRPRLAQNLGSPPTFLGKSKQPRPVHVLLRPPHRSHHYEGPSERWEVDWHARRYSPNNNPFATVVPGNLHKVPRA